MLEEFRRTTLIWDRASKKTHESIRISESDNGGRSLFVTVLNGNRIESLTGASLSLYWETKDKTYKGLDAFTAVDSSRGEFEINYTTEMLSHKGVLNTNLVLVDTRGRVVSETIPITIFKGIDDDAIQSDDSFTAVTQALVRLNNITYEMSNFATKEELQQVSISYKESFATIAALQERYPNGDAYNHVVLADGFIYTYRDGWKSTGLSGIGSGVADGTITPSKTTFITSSGNLYNKEDTRKIDGKYINFGVDPPSQANSVETEISHPVSAKPGEKFTLLFNTNFFGVNNCRVLLRDKNGNYIDRLTPTLNGNIGTLTMPAMYTQLDHFIFSLRKVDRDVLMVVRGTTYPSSYIPFLNQFTEDLALNNTMKKQVDAMLGGATTLKGKRIGAVGDSIMRGANSNNGWIGRIADKNDMTYVNLAQDGAVITRGIKTSGGAAVPSVLDQIDQLTGEHDYYLVEGGTNDADYSVPMGVITTGFNATLDETTFCGAFESACKKLINKGHGKQIGFIVAQKMGTVTWQNKRYPYFLKAMEVCRKWGVPYLNLWDDFYLNPAVEALNTAYYVDTQHLTPAGYDLTAPVIESWMRDVLPAGIGGSTPVLDFEGRITKLELEKANRKQEEFKPIDLLNNWVPENATMYHVPSYMKDELGFVHLRGIAIGGTGAIVFQLPVGYRPSKGEYFGGPRTRSSGSANVLYYIDSSGRFYMYTPNTESGGSNIVNLSGITFKAD